MTPDVPRGAAGTAAASPPGQAGPAIAPRRWAALAVLCMAQFMLTVDDTIVNIALPSIRSDLHFPVSSLAWVADSYWLVFGGFLLLGDGWAMSSAGAACCWPDWPYSRLPRLPTGCRPARRRWSPPGERRASARRWCPRPLWR